MTRGYVIMAQDTPEVKYTHCAEVLRDSILRHMPDSNVTIISEGEPGFQTDWHVYANSPYDETIKIEADMYIPSSIEHWWDILSTKDIVVCSTIRDFKGNISDCKIYRDFIHSNDLPDVYNGLTYFKKSQLAEDFFILTNKIFQNWEEFKKILKCDIDEQASTDWVYSLACHILGVENTTLPTFKEFSFVHMKQFVNHLNTEDWTESLIYEVNDTLRINTFPQRYPFHYHIKTFSDKLLSE